MRITIRNGKASADTNGDNSHKDHKETKITKNGNGKASADYADKNSRTSTSPVCGGRDGG